jgi:hypothetical protein
MDDHEIVDAEVMDDLLPAVVEDTALDLTYRPTMVLDPQQASALVLDLKELQRSVLVRGTDYDQIPGTRGAPVLLKPGAERLLQVFGLGHTVDRVDTDADPDGGHWGVTYKATVTKMLPDGRVLVLSSCEGYASYDEDKFWDGKWEGPKGKRVKVGQVKSPWNTVIKMAQKRALVGATLTATATSGLFTQDMEDYAHEHPREPVRQDPPPDAITPNQITLVQTLLGKLGITDRAAKLKVCGDAVNRTIESTKELTKADATKVIDHLKAMEAQLDNGGEAQG